MDRELGDERKSKKRVACFVRQFVNLKSDFNKINFLLADNVAQNFYSLFIFCASKLNYANVGNDIQRCVTIMTKEFSFIKIGINFVFIMFECDSR